jgi:hypothetical protein
LTDPSRPVPGIETEDSVATFEWQKLHLHVVTLEPLSPDQVFTIERALRRVSSVGSIADLLSTILGRSVRIRTERPSLDIRLEVGR